MKRRNQSNARSTKGAGKESSHRQLKVGEQIRHVLSEAALRGGLSGPTGTPLSLTFTQVRCSPDLRQAKAYFVPLGQVPLRDCEFALQAALPQLQASVAKKSTSKFTPKLTFAYDDSFDQADHLRALWPIYKPAL